MSTIELIALILIPTLVYSTPLILTSLGEMFPERSGIINVGLEGIMVMDAFSSIVFNLTMSPSSGSMTPQIAILVGGVVGILLSLIHAVATVSLCTGHITGGTVISLMAPALGASSIEAWYGKGQTDNITQNLGHFSFPGLADIPIIGPIFFKSTLSPTYCATLTVVIAWMIIFKTKFGLRLRSVGENPQVADTSGTNVYVIRCSGVLIPGLLGGMGGTAFVQSTSGNFSAGTIVGQGFTPMAAMISGKWNLLGAMSTSLFLGFAQNLSIIGMQLLVISLISPVLLQIALCLLTIIALVVFLGEVSGPKANGKNYIKSE